MVGLLITFSFSDQLVQSTLASSFFFPSSLPFLLFPPLSFLPPSLLLSFPPISSPKVVGVVNITTLNNRQYCVILDPAGADGKPQLGQKKLVKGEKSFFLMPGEKLEKGIQNVFVLGEDEGLILKAIEAFTDPDTVSTMLCL